MAPQQLVMHRFATSHRIIVQQVGLLCNGLFCMVCSTRSIVLVQAICNLDRECLRELSSRCHDLACTETSLLITPVVSQSFSYHAFAHNICLQQCKLTGLLSPNTSLTRSALPSGDALVSGSNPLRELRSFSSYPFAGRELGDGGKSSARQPNRICITKEVAHVCV